MKKEWYDVDPNRTTESGLYMYVTSELNDLTAPISVSQSGNNVHTLHPAGKYDYRPNANNDGFIQEYDNPISGLPANSYFRLNDLTHSSGTSTDIFHCDFWNDGKGSTCGGNKTEYLTFMDGDKKIH